MDKEYRGNIRIPVDLPVGVTYGDQIDDARGLNLSADGMFVKCEKVVVENEKVEVAFYLPGYNKRFQLPARVTWSKLVRTGNGNVVCAFGAQFVGIDNSWVTRNILESFIKLQLRDAKDNAHLLATFTSRHPSCSGFSV